MRLAGALAGVALLASLTACGGGGAGDTGADAGSPTSSTAASSGSSAAATGGSAQDEFLRLTAAHICAVQGTVYDDPAELAAAYDEAPEYPSLSDAQATAFGKRVTSDPDFSAQLLDEVTSACGG